MSLHRCLLLLCLLTLAHSLLYAAVPKQDPAVDEPVDIVDELKDVHPRVWFSEKELEEIKALYNSEAGKPYREALEGYIAPSRAPAANKIEWNINDTDAQRHGYWRLPTVVMHYAITGDQDSFKRARGYMEQFLAQEHWQKRGEVDSGMGAANVMIGAGMALDVLWHDLDPEFREQYRKKCFEHARRIYHLGHLKKGPHKVHYWQGDPANNHRWHRNAGLASCLFAAYTGAPEEQWLMKKFREEMDYVVKWLPHDGTSHESPGYMTFGLSHLVVGVHAADRMWGTEYLQHDFFNNVPAFKTMTMTPDFKQVLHYGDQGGTGVGKMNYALALFKCTSVHNLKAEQALLERRVAEHGPGWGWMGLLWYDPDVDAQLDDSDLPVSTFFEDVGVLVTRDKWASDGKAIMFKCGPFGGYGLNKFRNDNGFRYINVAHDDPDANSFIIYGDGAWLAETDRYSMRKQSANHNTILINGMGQRVAGRGEPMGWWQPARGNVDMTKIAVVTALKQTEDIDVIAGEAGGSYIAVNKGGTRKGGRPALERFRRALVFARGDYVLVLDDIRAPKEVDIDWLVQGQKMEPVNEAEGRFKLISKKGPSCNFQLQCSTDVSTSIVDSPATKKKKPLGWKQLRARAKTDQLFTASVYDLYAKELTVSLDASNPEAVVIVVSGGGVDDQWLWEPAKQSGDTYTLSATRAGKELISVTEKDRPRDVMKHLDEVIK